MEHPSIIEMVRILDKFGIHTEGARGDEAVPAKIIYQEIKTYTITYDSLTKRSMEMKIETDEKQWQLP